MKVWKFSKYIAAALVLTVATAVWAGMDIKYQYENYDLMPKTGDDLNERILRYKLGNVWGTRKYDHVQVINQEKGWYAVWNYGWDGYEPCSIVNADGELVKSLEEYGISYVWPEPVYDIMLTGSQDTAYLRAEDRETGLEYFIDRNTLEVFETGQSGVFFHVSGEYYLTNEGGDYGRSVLTPQGELVYQASVPLAPTEMKGYIIEKHSRENGADRLIEMASGHILYTAEPGEEIEDYRSGFIVIKTECKGTMDHKSVTCRYLLDENLQPALDGRLFYIVYFSDDFIFGVAYIDGYLGSEENQFINGEFYNRTAVAYSLDGQLLFEGKLGDSVAEYENGTLQIDAYIAGARPPKDRHQYINLKKQLEEGGKRP